MVDRCWQRNPVEKNNQTSQSVNLQWICASQAATTVFIAQRTICWIPPFSSSSSSKAVFKAGMKRPSYISAQPTWAEPFGSERMRMWLRTSWCAMTGWCWRLRAVWLCFISSEAAEILDVSEVFWTNGLLPFGKEHTQRRCHYPAMAPKVLG